MPQLRPSKQPHTLVGATLRRFLCPSHPINLEDVECNKCKCVVNRPVMTPCSNVVCCMCAVDNLQQAEPCPGCGTHHSSPPIPAGTLINKIVGSLPAHTLLQLQADRTTSRNEGTFAVTMHQDRSFLTLTTHLQSTNVTTNQ